MIHREADIINWGTARNIIGPDSQSDRSRQYQKTVEEVEELDDAIVMENRSEARDAIGDIIVTLVLQAQMWGLTITECLDAAWDEIKDRKGKMVDGIFVKESNKELCGGASPSASATVQPKP